MGRFKSPSFLGTVHFYIILVKAKSPKFFTGAFAQQKLEKEGSELRQKYRRSDGARYYTRCVQGINFVQIVIIELQPA